VISAPRILKVVDRFSRTLKDGSRYTHYDANDCWESRRMTCRCHYCVCISRAQRYTVCDAQTVEGNRDDDGSPFGLLALICYFGVLVVRR
jgi:hypothetical protein